MPGAVIQVKALGHSTKVKIDIANMLNIHAVQLSSKYLRLYL